MSRAWGSRVASDYSRRKPVANWLPPTSYSLTEINRTAPTGTWQVKDRYGNPTLIVLGSISESEFLGQCTNLIGSFPSDLSNRALTKARLKLKDETINLAVAYGERAQTARMIQTNLGRVAKGFKALRKWDFRGVQRALKGVGSRPPSWRKNVRNSWLELQYGWKPLLSDIHGAVEALDKADRGDAMVTIKASAKSKRKAFYTSPPDYSCLTMMVITGNVEYGSYVRIDACPSNGALATAASLGFTNPASVAWELTRLSFVVDWAYPLGDWISQFDATAGWEIKGYSRSNFTKIRLRGKGKSQKRSGNTEIADFSAVHHETRLVRTAGGSVPFAMLPSIKDPVSVKRVADALALLGQAFSGR